MEELAYIEVRVTNINNSLAPGDIDINEIREYISDVETFLYPTRRDKLNRPQISYDIQPGSVIHRFSLPITGVILFNGLIKEMKNRNNLNFLDYKRQAVIDKFQKKAYENGITIELINSVYPDNFMVINESTQFEMISPKNIEGEFYLYGEIYQEGGKKPNVHISTKEFGNLTVAATKQQIVQGEKKTYKPYGMKVRGKKNLENDTLSDLELIEFVEYKPVFDQNLLDKVIAKASINLKKISDVDAWIDDLKADGI